jgi:hypothetical protein
VVPETGLEPAHLTALDPKSSVSTKQKVQKWRCGGKGPFLVGLGMVRGFLRRVEWCEPRWPPERNQNRSEAGALLGKDLGRINRSGTQAPVCGGTVSWGRGLGRIKRKKPTVGLCGRSVGFVWDGSVFKN